MKPSTDVRSCVVRIAFLKRGSLSTFESRDVEILKDLGYEVEVLLWRGFQDVPRILKVGRRSDLFFCWFAEWPSALAGALFPRKPLVTVVGGYEVACVPEIRYGAWSSGDPLLRSAIRFSIRRSDVLLPVSEFTSKELLSRALPGGKVIVLPNGIDVERFRPHPQKEPRIVTVGSFGGKRALLKGIPTLLEAARLLPHVPFTIVGSGLGGYRLPPNVESKGHLEERDLVEVLGRSSVVAQLSLHESFGVALAEGMASGCVPVATRRGALPEVVGDTGFLVSPGDPEETKSAFLSALKEAPRLSLRARERVVNLFSRTHRKEGLRRVLDGLLEQGSSPREEDSPSGPFLDDPQGPRR